MWCDGDRRRTPAPSASRFSTRAFQPEDAPVVARRWPQAPSAAELRELAGGWLLLEDDELRGYAALYPLPGLPGQVELQSEVDPGACHRGGAARLLHKVVDSLDPGRVREVSYAVSSLHSDAAQLLKRYGFGQGHEEWQMHRMLPPVQARAPLPQGYALRSLTRPQAIAVFLRLYDESFSPMPWYQPYRRGEVNADLVSADDLLFLHHDDAPVGFAWIRKGEEGGEIEPMGIVPRHQGKGAGKALLGEALWRLSDRGMAQVVVGVWRQNERAIALYQKAGFRRVKSKYYLVYGTAQ